MIRWKLGLVAAAALLAIASVSSAASMKLTAQVDATYDPVSGAKTADSYVNDFGSHIYRVGIYAQLSGLAANESFGIANYNIALSGPTLQRNTLSIGGATTGLTNPKPNYVADSPATSLIITSTGEPLTNWYTGGENGDKGANTTDLVGMLTSINAANLDGLEDQNGVHATDPRLSIGTGASPGTRIGVVYVKWDGQTAGLFDITSALGATGNSQSHLLSNTFAATVQPMAFIPVPEPASIALMGLAGLGTVMFARRRRSA